MSNPRMTIGAIPQPSLPAERDVVHSLSDTKGSDDTTITPLPAERDEPVRTWFRDDCSCPVRDRNGDGCALSTDTTRRLCDHCEAHKAATPSVELDIDALQAAMKEAGLGVPYIDSDPIEREHAEEVAFLYRARLSPPTDTGAER